jgi:long-chain acyl-CoA synthetase
MRTLPEQFFATAEKFGEKTALKYKTGDTYTDLSFRALAEEVKTAAAAFLTLGVRPGERIGILCENRPEWVICDLAILLAGAVNVPIHTTFSPRIISGVLADSGCCMLVLSRLDLWRKLQPLLRGDSPLRKVIYLEEAGLPRSAAPEKGEIRDERLLSWSQFRRIARKDAQFPPLSPDDICSILYTSGTTGEPKGVVLTHRNFLTNAQASLDAVEIKPDDILLSFLPLSHILERTGGYYASLLLGGATVAFAKSLKELSRNLREVEPTIIIAVPRFFENVEDGARNKIRKKSAVFARLYDLAFQCRDERKGKSWFGLWITRAAAAFFRRKIRAGLGGRLRLAVSGGAALRPELARFFQKIGVIVCEGYGLTETSPVISVNRPGRVKIGTVGEIIAGIEVKIAADGEILTRGPCVTQGYWNDPETTRSVIDEEGWLHTGDLGAMDAEGYLTIIGRKKEMLVTAAGKNIWPEPLENLLNSSPFIKQSLVLGDHQKYLAALLVPDWEALEMYAREAGVAAADRRSLLDLPAVKALYRGELDRATADVAVHEKIAKFALVPDEFTPEREEMTPTLKKRRAVIAAHYHELVGELFRSGRTRA